MEWICEDCQTSGTVEVEPGEDVWRLMDKAGRLHDAISQECKPHFFARIFPKNYEI